MRRGEAGLLGELLLDQALEQDLDLEGQDLGLSLYRQESRRSRRRRRRHHLLGQEKELGLEQGQAREEVNVLVEGGGVGVEEGGRLKD